MTNFLALIRGRKIKTALEDTDLIAVATKNPTFDGGYQPTAIKFSDLQTQLGGGGTLQQVTDLGNITTNDINLDNSAIVLDNGSSLRKGWLDNGADGGIARECAVSYQDQWENGVQYFINQAGAVVRANSINGTTPDANFDVDRGYIVGSIFHNMNNQNQYICTDNTNGAAIWELYYNPMPYKVYTALLTQIGTNAPSAIVLENTLGENLFFGYDGIGLYSVNGSSIFTINKTFIIVNSINSNSQTVATFGKNIDGFSIVTRNSIGTAIDDVLDSTEIEIRVYN